MTTESYMDEVKAMRPTLLSVARGISVKHSEQQRKQKNSVPLYLYPFHQDNE